MNPSKQKINPRRRQLMRDLGLGLLSVVVVNRVAATTQEMTAAINAYCGGDGVTPKPGKVTLEVAQLVDNGNTVPVTIRVESPMTATDYVAGIALFNERNPQTDVAKFTLGPRCGRAQVSTRIRLATSQKLVAVARMNDGSCWFTSVEVIVTLAACTELEN
jgi:sulfur-oxidizing protein SoxY